MAEFVYVMSSGLLSKRKSLGSSVVCHKCGVDLKAGDSVVSRSRPSRNSPIYHLVCWEACFV